MIHAGTISRRRHPFCLQLEDRRTDACQIIQLAVGKDQQYNYTNKRSTTQLYLFSSSKPGA